ncbi:hypothetical protein PHISP_05409 [Aspergillus sp. HF37]|nr:hypothetical protein PHISP_05409 [Aspergillus sp. HF37]
MSTETPSDDKTPPSDTARAEIIARREADYRRFKHYAAITCFIASPILIALPPRRLNTLSAIQVSAFGMSTNHLIREYTGQSVAGHIFSRISSSQDLPSERAQAIQAKLRATRDAQIRDNGNTVGDELEKLQGQQQNDKGLAQRVWMGNETEDWKERRLQEEQKVLSEGKGYWDLIMRYISDAWSGGKQDQAKSDEAGSKDGNQ